MTAHVKTTLAIVVLSSAALAASQAPIAQTSAETTKAESALKDGSPNPDQIDALKSKIRIFEQLVVEAVDAGGQQFAQWARTIAPVELTPVTNPTVTSVYLPESGSLAFVVQVPEIRPTSVEIWQMRQQQRGVAQASGAQRVGAQGLVQGDPMGPAAEPRVAGCPSSRSADPDQVYSDCVKDALYGVLLDASTVLPVRAGQSVTLQADPVDPDNPLYRNQSRKLILSIKADDLLALQQGRLTREQARAKIVEVHF